MSNTAKASHDVGNFNFDAAQAFTTGDNESGYTLTRVDMVLTGGGIGSSAYTVTLRSNASGNRPGTILETLGNPASFGTGEARFTVPGGGIDLVGGTKYWVVLDVATAIDSGGIWGTNDDGEDAGAAPGWSIDDVGLRRAADVTAWADAPGSLAMKVAIHGRVKPPAPPAAPAAPTVSKTDGTVLTVSWTAPALGVTDYDVRYRRKGDAAWTEHAHNDTATTATIQNLLQGASWEAQVRATNRVGTGAWSEAGAGHTGPARFVRAKTGQTSLGKWRRVTILFTKDLKGTSGTSAVGYSVSLNGVAKSPAAVLATAGDERTASLSPGDTIQAGDTVEVSYNKPGPLSFRLLDADNQEVASFTGQPVTNTVPAAPVAPAAPSAPTVGAVSGTTSLSVSWTAPDDNRSPITDYDVRYFAGSADPTDAADWVEGWESGGHDHVGTALSATIAGLTASTAYRVQVRAKNGIGEGAWSASGTATTGTGTVATAPSSAPATPSKPTVSAVSGKRDLTVTWTAPRQGASAITDYDLRYYAGSADPADETDWVTENEASGLPASNTNFKPDPLTLTVTGLKAGTAYRVQVRAGNAQGEGPWSASGTATTNAATGTNSPPQRAHLVTVSGGGDTCSAKDADTPFDTVRAPAGIAVIAYPLSDMGRCSTVTDPRAPMFLDSDGADTLTFTARVANLPDNVVLGNHVPFVNPTGAGRLGLRGVVNFFGAAAFETTDVRVDVTATDTHGASVSTHVIFQVTSFDGTQNPSLPAVASRSFAPNEAIEPFNLPAATGGDVSVRTMSGLPYIYAVSGLPPGLVFDKATRTVSGTPTASGVYTVTYTADDFDQQYASKASATATDTADTASRTFTIKVGNTPRINRVVIVSHPTWDSDNDGSPDTYVQGDTILIDVEFRNNEPVAVGGDRNLRVRLDVGANDAVQTNSRRTATFQSLLYGDEVLRFAYTVDRANSCPTTSPNRDCDSDGVWVQMGTGNRVVFAPGTATVTHAETGVAADLTNPVQTDEALATTGDPGHKVDGSKTAAATGPVPTGATINGGTLTVTFNKALRTPTEAAERAELLAELVYDFAVKGVGTVDGGDKTASQHPYEVTVSSRTETVGTETVTRGVLTLKLRQPARAGETITLSHIGGRLTGTDGKRVPRFRDLAVSNATAGAAAPEPVRATVANRTLRVVFDEALDPSSAPAGARFRVDATDADEDSRYIRGTGTAVIDGTAVTVTLAEAVRPDEDASANYFKPATAALRGAGTGNPEVLSFDSYRLADVSESTPPLLLGGVVGQSAATPPMSTVALYFDEALDGDSEPAAEDFAVRAGGSAATVSAVAVEGSNVVLTLGRLAAAGTVFELTYTPGAQPIQDGSGNAVAGFRQTLSAVAAGTPALASATVSGGRLELTYDKPLDATSAPAAGQFSFHHTLHASDGGVRTAYFASVAAVSVEGRRAVLTLEHPVFPCAGATPFTVSYAVPTVAAEPRIQGLDGADAAAITHQAVTNTRSGWCGLGWFDSARLGSVIVRAERAFATDTAPDPAWFTVTASGGPVTVTGAAYSADDPHELKLSLSREPAPGETVTVSYTRPEGESGLWDAEGRQLADFADRPVERDAPAPARFESAATEPEGRGLVLTFTKDIVVAGIHTDYTVLVDGEGRETRSAFWEDDTVGLVLAEPVRWGETVTVAYAKPSSGVVLRDADEVAIESFGPEAVTNTVPQEEPENTPAAGAPTIAGTPRVGETLEASTADIEDADGLSGATFAFQWVSDDADVAGATGASYTLADSDEGSAIRVRVTFTDDAGNEETLTSAATEPVTSRTNQPATGAPAIAGTAQVGETLTASTADIGDADGLSGATFAYQWLANDADIAGATDASLTLDDAQVGDTVKVRVTFTDDAGNAETLTSAATEAVTARPLTAEFRGMPAEHDGRRLFSFELVFSENFPGRLPYKTLRDSAFTVTNGRVRGAERVVQGENRRWTISVRPSSNDDVTITLPAGSVSTESGRPLSNSPSARVAGPVGISVADARVEEGAGAVLAFAVTLSRAATSALTVDYATSDGSALAGEDYTAASGTLSFQAGDTSATVEVGVLDDAHDEGEETLTLTLSNASGAVVADGEATGTIENKDLMPAALLARIGRATAEQVVTHIEERMAAPRRRGFTARFAGRELQPGSERDFALGFLSSFAQPMGAHGAGGAPMHGAAMGAAPMGGAPMGGAAPMGDVAMGGAAPMGMGSHTGAMGMPGRGGGIAAAGMSGAGGAGIGGAIGMAGRGAAGGMTGATGTAGQQPPMGHGPVGDAREPGLFSTLVGHDPLASSEFELNREARGGTVSLWSRNSRSHFSGSDDALSLNGDVRTSMFGADWARGPLTVGLSVGRTLGLGGYSGPSSGQMSTSMTGFYPWVGYQVNDKVSVWGVTGYGTGMLSLTPGSAAALETGVSMAMTAVGTRGELIGSPATGGFAMAFKADALRVGTASELLDGPAGRLNASEAGVTRVRTALEGSRGFNLGGGRLSLTPSVEVGLRRDGGDAETGAGMDLGGGLAFTDTVSGLSLDVRVRTLVVHQADGFSDRGMSLSFGWDPTPSSPLGLTAKVAPSWGGQARGGAEALWGSQMAYGAGSHQMHDGGERVDAEVGYGLPVAARLVGTPRVGLTASPHGRDYRVGYVLGMLEQGSGSFELGVDAQRREIPGQGEASNGFAGRATIGW